jgi:glycosyltransferase involved in cell wall biosynthesis
LLVVGKAWTTAERERLHDLGLEDRVRRIDSVDDETLCRLYNQAEAFVYPSLYEGFGLPLLEAAACGCPIVASRIPSTEEIAGDVPIYFEPTDAESLAAALERAISEGRSSERREGGFRQITRYSWDKTAEQTLAVYHSLI